MLLSLVLPPTLGLASAPTFRPPHSRPIALWMSAAAVPAQAEEEITLRRPEPSLSELMQMEAKDSLPRIQAEADALFDAVDTNGDGLISVEELYTHLSGVGFASASAVGNIFSLFDLDMNGKLDRDELRDAFIKYDDPGLRLALGLGTSEADVVFDQIDANRDGVISQAELLTHMQANDYLSPATTAATVFKTLDVNRDGSISRAELREGYMAYSAVREALGLTGATNSKGKGVASESIVVTIMQTLDDGEVLMLRRPAPLTQAELEDFERSETLITSSQLRRLQPVHKVKRTRKAQPVRA
jgi:Ca2+-binding EF-hand superfamily protein